MPGKASPERLHAALERALRRGLRRRPQAELRVLPEMQFVVREGLLADPAAASSGIKAASRVPGPTGYEIYLGIRSGVPEAADIAPAAAVQAPLEETAAALHFEAGRAARSWHLAMPGGQAVVVLRVTAGPQAPHETINALLQAIGEVLR